MDPITHAASGALLAMACDRPRTAWALPLAALVSASPDVDVFFSSTPVGYLLFHRGITHSLAAVPLLGLVAALCMFVYWKDRNTWNSRRRGSWSFGQTWALAMCLLLLHIWLDCVTTYGTMIFLPFSDYRVRLNGIFIVDLLLTLPLLLGLWKARCDRGLAALLVAWTLLYPAACVGLRIYHESQTAARLQEEGVHALQLTVLPDALAPLYWRALYETATPYVPSTGQEQAQEQNRRQHGLRATATPHSVHQQGLNWRGQPATAVHNYPAAESALTSLLAAASTDASVFFHFTLMPLQWQRALEADGGTAPGVMAGTRNTVGTEYQFYDLRFGTMLPWVEKIMQSRNHGDIPFLLQAKRQGEEWTAVRMEFSGANRSSPWEAPVPPQKPSWWQWLIGWR